MKEQMRWYNDRRIIVSKKLKLSISIVVLAVGLLVLTNPSESDYFEFTVKEYGEPPRVSSSAKLERINFFVFSTYTPVFQYEKGITHLGIMGTFIQISDGQFDYPFWLEFFN